jgi:hypothetical protein
VNVACNHTGIRYVCTSFMTHERRWYGCVDCGMFFEVAAHTMLSPERAYEVVHYPTQDTGDHMRDFTANLPALRAARFGKIPAQTSPTGVDLDPGLVDLNGGVVLPGNVREAMGIAPGQYVYFVADGDKFCLVSQAQMKIALGDHSPGETALYEKDVYWPEHGASLPKRPERRAKCDWTCMKCGNEGSSPNAEDCGQCGAPRPLEPVEGHR